MPVGAKLLVSGKIELFSGRRTMPHPEHVVPADRPDLLPAIEPVWPLTGGLWPRQVASAMAQALARLPSLPGVARCGAAAAREMAGVRRGAARGAGAVPRCLPNAIRSRLAYDELLADQVALAVVRGRLRARPGRSLTGDGTPARQGAGALRLHADRLAAAGAGGDRCRPGIRTAHAAPAARRCRLRQDGGGAAGDAARGGSRQAGSDDGADRGAGEAASPHAVAPVTGAGGAADRRRERARAGAAAARIEGRRGAACRRHARAVPGERGIPRPGAGGDRRAAPVRRRSAAAAGRQGRTDRRAGHDRNADPAHAAADAVGRDGGQPPDRKAARAAARAHVAALAGDAAGSARCGGAQAGRRARRSIGSARWWRKARRSISPLPRNASPCCASGSATWSGWRMDAGRGGSRRDAGGVCRGWLPVAGGDDGG